jgi:hypothetical protein
VPEEDPLTIECCKHGRGIAAIVCGHLVRTDDSSQGFVENSSYPEDLQGWCMACEDYFVHEGSMTDAFRTFNQMTIVCVTCYQEIKARNELGGA